MMSRLRDLVSLKRKSSNMRDGESCLLLQMLFLKLIRSSMTLLPSPTDSPADHNPGVYDSQSQENCTITDSKKKCDSKTKKIFLLGGDLQFAFRVTRAAQHTEGAYSSLINKSSSVAPQDVNDTAQRKVYLNSCAFLIFMLQPVSSQLK